jgi:hypothetical protein
MYLQRSIANIASSLVSMLQFNKSPINTPIKYKEDFSKINFFTSKKFYVVFCSVVILAIFYLASIVVLFLTASFPNLTLPFVSIFTETIKILAVIIASYLGVQTVLDYKMQSNSSVNLEGDHKYTSEEINENVIINYAEKFKNDPSYAPLEWIQKDNE